MDELNNTNFDGIFEGVRTVEEAQNRYRKAVKGNGVHPDSTYSQNKQVTSGAFIQLKEKYEKTLKLLKSSKPTNYPITGRDSAIKIFNQARNQVSVSHKRWRIATAVIGGVTVLIVVVATAVGIIELSLPLALVLSTPTTVSGAYTFILYRQNENITQTITNITLRRDAFKNGVKTMGTKHI